MTETTEETINRLIWQNASPATQRLHAKLKPEDDLRGTLAMADLRLIQAVLDLEDEWPGVVYIDDDELEQACTVGDLHRIIGAKLKAPAAS